MPGPRAKAYCMRLCEMSRSYKGTRFKKNQVYSVEDIQRTASVTANTVSNWVVAGLQPSDGKKPYVFRGGVISAFLDERRKRTKLELKPGEFKCTGCKSAVFADISSVREMVVGNGAHMHVGRCSECGAHVTKFISQADREAIERRRNPNTTVESLHEGKPEDAGGICKGREKDDQIFWPANDRLIHKWQTYAGRYDEKTIARHLSAIRFCEDVTEGKPFHEFTIKDVSLILVTR